MVSFHHTIASAQGLHARPVAVICRFALDHASKIELSCRGEVADASDMIGLMGLNAVMGDDLEVRVEGPDEGETAQALRDVLDANL